MEVKVAQSSPTLCDPIPSPADLPDPRIKPESPALQADSLPTELSGMPLSHLIASYIYWDCQGGKGARSLTQSTIHKGP